jgi:hypothetical protein
MKSGSLNLLEPSGPHRACYWTPLPLHRSGVMSVNMSTCVKSGFIAECHQIHNVSWMWYGRIPRSCVKIRHTVFCGIPVSKLHRVVDFDGLCDMACCTTAMFKSLLPVLGRRRISSVVVRYQSSLHKPCVDTINR